MKRLYAILFVIAGIALASANASAQMMKENPMVGGAAMFPSKTIVANAMNSADHTTLVAAVRRVSKTRVTADVSFMRNPFELK